MWGSLFVNLLIKKEVVFDFHDAIMPDGAT